MSGLGRRVQGSVRQAWPTSSVPRGSEGRFRQMLDQCHDGFSILDREGNFLDTSAAVRRILGYTPEMLLGTPVWDGIHPEDCGPVRAQFAQLIAEPGATLQRSLRFLHREGSWRWLEVFVTNCLDRPDIRAVVVSYRDVTEARRAEEINAVLRELGRELNTVTQPAEAARIVLAAADRLLGWDAAWLELQRPSASDSPGVVAYDLIDGVRREIDAWQGQHWVSPWTTRALRQGPFLLLRDPETLAAARVEEVHRFGDQSRLAAAILCVPLRSGERAFGALSIQSYTHNAYAERDLSLLQMLADFCSGALERTTAMAAQEQLQAQLLQSQKMEAVGRLAGGIAHDFNNMLAVINGYSELLLARQEPASPQCELLKQISLAGERAAGLTRQLLTFSRQQPVHPVDLDPGALIHGLEKMLGRLIGENIQVRTQIEPELGRVNVDPGQLEQVLMNLVVNARDAMPEGGALEIRAADVELDAARAHRCQAPAPGPYVEIAVRDTGCGMTPDILSRIFEPFFTTKPVDEGTGLGLSTVYGIMQQAGGGLSVQSVPGKGSTFSIYLPRVAPAEIPPAPVPAAQAALSGGPETLLVVEDEPQVRTVVSVILRQAGYAVLVAQDPEEALRLCASHPGEIDLLLTDVVMPQMSGYELAERVRPQHPLLRVLFMSGYPDEARTGPHTLPEGAAYMQKPFLPITLCREVRRVLDQ